jgi:hypothetical protein
MSRVYLEKTHIFYYHKYTDFILVFIDLRMNIMTSEYHVIQTLLKRKKTNDLKDGNIILQKIYSNRNTVGVELGISETIFALDLNSCFDYSLTKEDHSLALNFKLVVEEAEKNFMELEFKFKRLNWKETLAHSYKSKRRLTSIIKKDENSLTIEISIPKTFSFKDQVKLGVYSVCKLFNCPKPVITGDYSVEFEAS